MNEVKLNWKFDPDTKALRADGPGETLYRVLDNIDTHLPDGYLCERRDTHEPMSYVDWFHENVPSLEEAMALCQRDAEEQERRRIDHLTAEQDEARQAALKSFLEMPCPARDDSPFAHDGLYRWPDGSFHSAPPTSTGLRYASIDDYDLDQKEGTTKRAVPQFCPDGSVNLEWERAPVGSGFVWLKDSYRIKFPPSPQETTPRSEHEAERFKNNDDPVTWEKVAKFVNANFDLLWKHVETMPIRMDGLAGPEIRRRVEELEGIVRSGVGGYSYDARIDGFMKRLDDIGTTASKAASRVGQLWQKQTLELREASKIWAKLEQLTNRLDKLEAK